MNTHASRRPFHSFASLVSFCKNSPVRTSFVITHSAFVLLFAICHLPSAISPINPVNTIRSTQTQKHKTQTHKIERNKMTTALTPSELETATQPDDLETLAKQLRDDAPRLQEISTSLKSLDRKTDLLGEHMGQVTSLRKSRSPIVRAASTTNAVSDDCARYLAATFIKHCERSRSLEALCSVPSQQTALVEFAKDTLAPVTKTALTTTDIPLPTEYSGELRELISQFGVVRRKMQPYPIGMGTSRPARMGTRPSFGSIAMSASISEKSPTVTRASTPANTSTSPTINSPSASSKKSTSTTPPSTPPPP
jgi:hypothetical protein